VQRVIEIGTWFGGGSTMRLATGLHDTATGAPNCVDTLAAANDGDTKLRRCCHSFLITFEVFRPAWQNTVRDVKDLPVQAVLGTTVSASAMLAPSDVPANEKGAHFKLHYERDRSIMESGTPKLHATCDAHAPGYFDAVLIDGNEYTGWAEYQVRAQRTRRQLTHSHYQYYM
jgi:hypothetical protein